MTKIRAVLFDLDNTLIDFMRMKRLACEAAVDAMMAAGLKTNRKKALELLFSLYDKYGYEYKRIFQALLKEMTGKVDYGIVGTGIVAYRRTREGLLIPYPDVVQTLDKLRRKGIRLGIVTDAPRIEAWIRLAAMQIQDRFDVVITFDDSRSKKPSPKPFLIALRRLKVSPEEAIVVGDSISKDIEPARKLGMTTVLAGYGRRRKMRNRADFEADAFRTIFRIVTGPVR